MDLKIIDIHSHILPALDDGAEDMDTALEMAEVASRHKTESIILTPHFSLEYNLLNYYGKSLKEHFQRFCNEIKKEKIPLEVYLGMEIFYSDDILDLIKRDKLIGLNNSRYLLVEFNMDAEAEEIFNAVKNIKRLNLVPVIAHPERYEIVKEYPEFAHDLVEKGVLCQCNAGSIHGVFGRRSAEAVICMLNCNDVHFIASDCHDVYRRTPILSECYRYVYRRYGELMADRLFYINPRCVIMNQDIKY